MVIAVPFPLVVQGYQKQLRAFNPIQAGTRVPGAVSLSNDGFAHWNAKVLQDGSLQQECLDRWNLVGQHLIHQVSGNIWIVSG